MGIVIAKSPQFISETKQQKFAFTTWFYQASANSCLIWVVPSRLRLYITPLPNHQGAKDGYRNAISQLDS